MSRFKKKQNINFYSPTKINILKPKNLLVQNIKSVEHVESFNPLPVGCALIFDQSNMYMKGAHRKNSHGGGQNLNFLIHL